MLSVKLYIRSFTEVLYAIKAIWLANCTTLNTRQRHHQVNYNFSSNMSITSKLPASNFGLQYFLKAVIINEFSRYVLLKRKG